MKTITTIIISMLLLSSCSKVEKIYSLNFKLSHNYSIEDEFDIFKGGLDYKVEINSAQFGLVSKEGKLVNESISFRENAQSGETITYWLNMSSVVDVSEIECVAFRDEILISETLDYGLYLSMMASVVETIDGKQYIKIVYKLKQSLIFLSRYIKEMKRNIKDTRIVMITRSTNNASLLIPDLSEARKYLHASDYTIKKLINGGELIRRFRQPWMDKYKLCWGFDYEQENKVTINSGRVELT